MSYTLPPISNDSIRSSTVTQFGGYTHTLAAQDGQIWDMENLTSNHYPVMSPRSPRWLQRTISGCLGLTVRDILYWVGADGCLYSDTSPDTALLSGLDTSTQKTFASINAYLLIYPDKVYYRAYDGKTGSLEASVTVTDAAFQDGSYAGEDAEANTIYSASTTWGDYFSVGDGVSIKGSTSNDSTIIIREIDGHYLRFYEHSFTNEDMAGTSVTISRSVPALDYICENDNRLWGVLSDDIKDSSGNVLYTGNSIYASKLGDPFNWNVFDGVSTDSYAVAVGSPEKFTAIVSYIGYPIAFKENHIYKVYGDYPSNYQVIESATLGVMDGSAKSLAVANETLYYLSRTGVMQYSGGVPRNISVAFFGMEHYSDGVAGSDGRKYHISIKGEDGAYTLFVYDSYYGLWHKEDHTQAVDFAYSQGLYFLNAAGELWLDGDTAGASGTAESSIESYAEFGDFTMGSAYRKENGKVILRVEVEEGATLTLKIKYEGEDDWITADTVEETAKGSFYLAVMPRRNDHFRLKLEGTGDWKLWALTVEYSTGSAQRNRS